MNTKGIEDLLKERKLALFLDIDNTIVNSVITSYLPYSLLRMEDTFAFPIIDNQTTLFPHKLFCLVKLRPDTVSFLKIVSQHFKIIFCTLGSDEYAQEIRNRLNRLVSKKLNDQTFEAIEPIIISRDDHQYVNSEGQQFYSKNLDKILKNGSLLYDRSVSVILDDRMDVWNIQDVKTNLVKIHPYNIFSMEKNETNLSIKQDLKYDHLVDYNDQFLRKTWKILSYIHRRFFEELKMLNKVNTPPNIGKYLKKRRMKVLKGVHIYPIGNQISALIPIAKLYGALISLQNDSLITHIVVENKYARGIQSDQKNEIFIVHKKWLKDSIKHWKRQAENDYLTCQTVELN